MRAHRPSGFTLIEIVVALALLAIASFVAVPEFTNLVASRRVATAADDLFSTLYYARSEAIRLNQSVVVEPYNDGEWSDGWQVPDPLHAGSFLVHHARTGLVVTEASDAGSITYLPSGRVPAGNPPSFSLCDAKRKVKERVVTIDLSGLPGIKVPGDCP